MRQRGIIRRPGRASRGGGINPRTGMVSPQAKLIRVNDRIGNSGIANQQGATRSLYDTLPLNGSVVLEFFLNPNTAVPFGTNIDSQQGILGVGESLALNWIDFQILVQDDVTGQLTTFDTVSNAGGAFTAPFYAGTFSFQISNQVTLKPVSNKIFLPEFNPTELGAAAPETFELLTDQVIPPLLPFRVRLEVTDYGAAIADTFIRCTITGIGSILNTQQTY